MGGPSDETTYTYGDGHPMNPSRGGIGFSGGGWGGVPAAGGYSWDYDGENWQPGQPSLTWGNDYVGVDSEGDSWGWSIPLGPVSIGEVYKPDGTFGTFSIGRGGVGLGFEVHEDNPTTNMAAHGARAYDLRDDNGTFPVSHADAAVSGRASGYQLFPPKRAVWNSAKFGRNKTREN